MSNARHKPVTIRTSTSGAGDYIAMSSPLITSLDQLIGYFNRRVMDVPDGFFDRDARFVLNGVTFEERLGRVDDDPLIRMIARGAAGYRFAAKPLLHALDTVLVSRDAVDLTEDGATVVMMLRGTLRGSRDVLDERVTFALSVTPDGKVRRADVRISEAALDRIRAARSR